MKKKSVVFFTWCAEGLFSPTGPFSASFENTGLQQYSDMVLMPASIMQPSAI